MQFKTRYSHSRVRTRNFLITAGVLALLVWSLSGSATLINESEIATGNDIAKPVESEPSAVAHSVNPIPVPFKPPSADLSQVRNGGVGCDKTVPNSCDDPADWVNGNAGASNAHYQEGQSIPYRLVMKDLPLGSNTVVIEWDVKHSGAHAIDFITHYQRINESVQPCGPANHPEDIVPGCNPANFTTFDIPAPTGLNSPKVGFPQNIFLALALAQRRMTMFNGTINSMTYATPQGDLSQAQASTRVSINFTAASSTVVLAWGGHIARAIDWGQGSSASGISGSPYHTRLISLNGSGGNQDRSLSAAAVSAPPPCALTNDNIDVCDLPAVTTHALQGTASTDLTYSFNLVNSGGSAAFISSSDTNPSDGTISANVTTSGAGSYTITLTASNAGGSSECPATVRVHQPPAAAAGDDAEQCETSGFAFQMNASSTVPTGGSRTWSIDAANSTTTASIVNASDEDPVITLNGVGTVRAVLTVSGPSCANAVDTVDLTVSPKANANAGADQAVCANNPAVTLNGSISGSALSATWSGGTGTFSPNANTLNAVYTPSAAEITSGSVTLTLTTNDPAGSCGAAVDTMTITINPNPNVVISLEDACAATAHLHATVTGDTAPYTFTWKKNNVVVGTNSADLTLTGPGTYTVSVTDSSSTSCPSNTDTFVVCYTEGPAASVPKVEASRVVEVAQKPKSETSIWLARAAVFVFKTLAFIRV
ncbi:MAG TPA: hypothetical protein VFS76_17495 [Pyrinomonadaceae bacterium]|nr:hypothetical protein [Pyrinomonadaceae bacterium]